MTTLSKRYAKAFTQPWKNSFVFDNIASFNNGPGQADALVASTAPITQAFASDVFGVEPLYYLWNQGLPIKRVDHFKMPIQTKPVEVQNFHLEFVIGFSNQNVAPTPVEVQGFLQTDLNSTNPIQANAASAQVLVLLWHQKAAYLNQQPNGQAGNPNSLYIPIGGFTRNVFSPIMQPYQDLVASVAGHVDRFVGYHNKFKGTVSTETGRKLTQDDTIAVSILYQWMPNGYPGNLQEEGPIPLPPLEGTVALTYSALS